MERQTVPRSSPLILLKSGAHGAPLFIVHGLEGTVDELKHVASKIGIPGPVYALQAKGIDNHETPLASLFEMAERNLATIRDIQPRGPYCLCGFSFGGLVALEMARRLRAERETIPLLVLVDAYAHPATWPFLARARMNAARLFRYFRTAARQPLHNSDLPLPLARLHEAGSAALASYRPRFYPAAVTFLKAEHRELEFPDRPEQIWQRLVADLVIHTVPGSHRSLLSEHANAFAARITACMLDALCPRAFQNAPLANRNHARQTAARRHLETRPA